MKYGSIVSTTSTNESDGKTVLRRITATNSSVNVRCARSVRPKAIITNFLQNLFVSRGSGTIDAIGIDVQGMTFMETVFDVQGVGSSTIVEDLVVRDNDLSDHEDHSWIGVVVSDEGMGSFSNVTFCENARVHNFAHVSKEGSINFQNVHLCRLSGGVVVVRIVCCFWNLRLNISL